MSLEERFNCLVKEWEEHVNNGKFSSNANDVRCCKAYTDIISLGRNALPLIRKLYDRDHSDNFALDIIKGHGLFAIVREIAGQEFNIPEELAGRIRGIEEYTKSWLDNNNK